MADNSSHDIKDERSLFHYDSLLGQPLNAIRLLTVHPGNSVLINCTLAITCLDTKPNFKALSYMWGKEPPNHTILINDKPFKLRPNLFDFLSRLHKSYEEPTCIWIDAICVNQEDIPERNSQVCLMSTIYNRAELVIAWLGIQEPPGSLGVLDHDPNFIHQLVHARESRKKLHKAYNRSGRRRTFQHQREITLALDTAMEDLVNRPYWDRAWIVQEIYHAHDVQVWFGADGSQSLQALGSWLFVYRLPHEETRPPPSSSFLAVYALNSQVSIHLPQLLLDFRHTQCADPRDKVYAFLSMTGHKFEGLEVGYEKSLEQLCDDVERRDPSCVRMVRCILLGRG